MSRKGNKLITIPQGVNVNIQPNNVTVSGQTGTLVVGYPADLITVEVIENNKIKVSRKNDEKQARIFHGTVNSNIANAVCGIANGYTKKLKIVGVGYKASVSGNKLTLAIGFSHPVIFDIPQGIKVVCPTPTEIHISGINKFLVGELAANVRATRKPEPYNGKGIMYFDEHIIRKVGKTAEGAKNMKQQNFNRKAQRALRHKRTTNYLKANSNTKPRLVVAKTNTNIIAQIVDDKTGKTLFSSSISQLKLKGCNVKNATLVGEDIAKKAVANNTTLVVFDRGGNKYHGRVKAVAEAARANGLKF